MATAPAPARVKTAREGLISANGRLPHGWQGENADWIEVRHVDLGPEGPGITLTLGFAATNPAPFVSVVMGDYLPIANEDVAVLRVDVEFSRLRAVSAAFLVLREWIAGGTYVGQATRPVELGGGMVPAVAGRMATGDSRLFQPLLTVQRERDADGEITVRLRRAAFASLHAHPGWLAA